LENPTVHPTYMYLVIVTNKLHSVKIKTKLIGTSCTLVTSEKVRNHRNQQNSLLQLQFTVQTLVTFDDVSLPAPYHLSSYLCPPIPIYSSRDDGGDHHHHLR
jgi:hypothetical protein